jgi:hypothetical protein
MKRLIVTVAALVWAGAAFAGDYHLADSLRCSECHTMHAQRAHGLASANANDDVGWNGGPAFPNDHLLIQRGVNQTCLACHDGTQVPDVFGQNELGPAQNQRSAGALNGTIPGHDSTANGYLDWMGHTMGSMANPPGYTLNGGTWDVAAEGFHCGNCHAIHGSSTFRNLGAGPAVFATTFRKVGTAWQKANGSFNGIGPTYNAYNEATGSRAAPAAGMDVVVNAPARTYVTSNIEFRATAADQMGQYCAVCHGKFHNVAADTSNVIGATGAFIRHPTTGVAIGSGQNTTTLGGEAFAGNKSNQILARPLYTDATHTAGEAGCLSCHKGHGNKYGFGLVAPAGSAADVNLEQGDAPLISGKYPFRNLCVTCHAAY